MYAAPYDLLALTLRMRQDRLRAILVRWRRAGLAESGRIGPGPAWCWLTRSGMRAAGFTFPAQRPPLARLAHIRAVLACRLALEADETFRDGHGFWRSERRIRAAAGRVGIGHVPDAEVLWPPVADSTVPDQCWAIEVELTPKPADRTTTIMAGLLAAPAGWAPGAAGPPRPRYDRIVYLCSASAMPVVARAAATMPGPIAGRVLIDALPEGALL
jgi:hypothetical protein